MKCNFCGETNEFQFYKYCKSKCKACIRKAVEDRRRREYEKIKEYDRNRPNAKERVEKNKERIKRYKTENPEKYKKYAHQKNEWSKKNSHKKNANAKVQRALFNGVIIKPRECESCGMDKKLEAHHEDYNKPLEVIWLCIECHNKRHIELNEIKRKSI